MDDGRGAGQGPGRADPDEGRDRQVAAGAVPLSGARWWALYRTVSAGGVVVGLLLAVVGALGPLYLVPVGLAIAVTFGLMWPRAKEATMEIGDDALAFHHEGVLRRPLVVPFDEIAFAWVAADAIEAEAPGPMLGVAVDVPKRANCMIGFTRPRAVPEIRFLMSRTNMEVVDKQRVGVLCKVADPGAAAASLSKVVDVRHATAADLDKLRYSPEDQARMRRRLRTFLGLLVVAGVVSLATKNFAGVVWFGIAVGQWAQMRRRSQPLDVRPPEA